MTKEQLKEVNRVYATIEELKDLKQAFQNENPLSMNFEDAGKELYEDWKKLNIKFISEKLEELELTFESL